MLILLVDGKVVRFWSEPVSAKWNLFLSRRVNAVLLLPFTLEEKGYITVLNSGRQCFIMLAV